MMAGTSKKFGFNRGSSRELARDFFKPFDLNLYIGVEKMTGSSGKAYVKVLIEGGFVYGSICYTEKAIECKERKVSLTAFHQCR